MTPGDDLLTCVPEAEETERVRRVFDKGASRYDRDISFFERVLFGDGRRWVCSRALGDVLEVAVGTGRNLPVYPDGVRIIGVELSPAMLTIARERAGQLGRQVDLRLGDAQALEFPSPARAPRARPRPRARRAPSA